MATTWNPADLSATTLSGGNLTATPTAVGGVRSIATLAGKCYFELTFIASSSQNVLGIATGTAVLAGGSNVANTFSAMAGAASGGGTAINGTFPGSIGAFGAGGVCGIAVDVGANLIWLKNVTGAGTWNPGGAGNPAAGTGGLSISALTGSLYALSSVAVLSGSTAVTANFGASGFTGAVPSGFTAGIGPPPATAGPRVSLIV